MKERAPGGEGDIDKEGGGRKIKKRWTTWRSRTTTRRPEQFSDSMAQGGSKNKKA